MQGMVTANPKDGMIVRHVLDPILAPIILGQVVAMIQKFGNGNFAFFSGEAQIRGRHGRFVFFVKTVQWHIDGIVVWCIIVSSIVLGTDCTVLGG